ncbi:hypothetical protein ES703_121231 [subsurface metagenome]
MVEDGVYNLWGSVWVVGQFVVRAASPELDETDEVDLYHNFFTGLVTDIAFAILLVEISEYCVPGSVIGAFAG